MMSMGTGAVSALALGLTVGSPATEQLAQVITHALAPAFLLGAVSGFVSVLVGRANSIIDQSRTRRVSPLLARLPRSARTMTR